MKALAVFALTLAIVPAAHAKGDKQFPDASEMTPELIELYEDTNAICRGNSGNDVKTWANCAARSVYGTALNERDWCYGKEDHAGAEMEWHECEATSLRFEPVDINAL